MTLTVNFDVNPRYVYTASYGTCWLRFYDKSITTNGVINSWKWKINGPNKAFTTDAGGSNLNIATASSFFVVGDRVMLGGTLPTGLSATVVYWVKTATSTAITLSLTSGGATVTYTHGTGSGTWTATQGSDLQNPLIPVRNHFSSGNYSTTLTCNDSGGTGATSATITNLDLGVGTPTKPTSSGIYSRISIFVYDATNATAINRMKTTNNNLYFQDLKVTGSMNKAGQASFKVYNSGGATATEKGLMVADKNVAIISGRSVIWSGKILRAVQGKMSLFDVATPACTWTVECESDIAKMRKQNVKAANLGEYQKPVGYIVNKLVENSAATDIDWRGTTETSLISFEGPAINFTITDADMYDQFMTLATFSGYDWRTRNNWLKYAYGASKYTAAAKTVEVAAITPYGVNGFAGRWLLFVNTTNADATANKVGIRAYGNIASNTATVITMTSITNSDIPPASSDYVIILGNPVLDFTSDLRQPTYQCTFTANKARAAALQNAYEMNDKSDFKDVATKVTAKGKSQFVNPTKSLTGKMSATETATLVGKDAWDNNTQYFKQSTFITQKTSAWVYSYVGSATTIILIGHNLAMKNGDWIYFNYVRTTGVGGGIGVQINATPTEQTQTDGTPTTTVSMGAAPDTVNWMRYSVAMLFTLYVKDISIYTSGTVNLNIGTTVGIYATASGTDAVYGPYLTLGSIATYDDHPHLPGCLVSTTAYTEAAPETNSPVNLFGLIQETYSVDQNVSEPELEVYATSYLLNHSTYYKKGGFWCFVYDWFRYDLRPASQYSEVGWLMVGDLIAVLQNTADTATDVEYGQYKNQWQVLAWTLDGNQMTVTAELGDFERNTNTLINERTTGINYTIT